jgi:hypothetical protein
MNSFTTWQSILVIFGGIIVSALFIAIFYGFRMALFHLIEKVNNVFLNPVWIVLVFVCSLIIDVFQLVGFLFLMLWTKGEAKMSRSDFATYDAYRRLFVKSVGVTK